MLRFALLALMAGCHSSSTPDGSVPDASVDLALTYGGTLTSAISSCLALQGGRLFFVDERATGNAVASIATSGGAVTVHAPGGGAKSCLAVDDTWVYFVTTLDADAGGGDTIARVHWASADTPQTLAAGQHVVSRLRLQSSKLWWITDVYGPGDGMFSGKDAIVSLAADGSSGTTVVFSDLVPKASQLAVDAANAYYSDASGMYIRALNGLSAAIPVGTSTFHLNAFAIDATHLALVEIPGAKMGDVALFNLDGSGRKVIGSSLASAPAVDGSGVYADQNGKLVRLALDGSGATELAQSMPRDIALDPTSIYFTDGASILKLGR